MILAKSDSTTNNAVSNEGNNKKRKKSKNNSDEKRNKQPRALEVFFDTPEFFEALRKFLTDEEVRNLGYVNKAARDVCFSLDPETKIWRLKMRQLFFQSNIHSKKRGEEHVITEKEIGVPAPLSLLMENLDKIDWTFVEELFFHVDGQDRASMTRLLTIMQKCCPYISRLGMRFDFGVLEENYDDTVIKSIIKEKKAWFQSSFAILQNQKNLRRFEICSEPASVVASCPSGVLSDFLRTFTLCEVLQLRGLHVEMNEQLCANFFVPVAPTLEGLFMSAVKFITPGFIRKNDANLRIDRRLFCKKFLSPLQNSKKLKTLHMNICDSPGLLPSLLGAKTQSMEDELCLLVDFIDTLPNLTKIGRPTKVGMALRSSNKEGSISREEFHISQETWQKLFDVLATKTKLVNLGIVIPSWKHLPKFIAFIEKNTTIKHLTIGLPSQSVKRRIPDGNNTRLVVRDFNFEKEHFKLMKFLSKKNFKTFNVHSYNCPNEPPVLELPDE